MKVQVIILPTGQEQTFTAGGWLTQNMTDGTLLTVVSELPPDGQPVEPSSIVASFGPGHWAAVWSQSAVVAP